MTDVNIQNAAIPNFDGVDNTAAVDRYVDIIELLFFAYRDFISDPDEILREYDFGRAHHRVIHFVNRNPGMRVTDLLEILKITKQSLGRVLKQLVDAGFIVQKPGPTDRRQRLLYTTADGQNLAARLSEPQARRIADVIASMPPDARVTIDEFLFRMVNEADRSAVSQVVGRSK